MLRLVHCGLNDKLLKDLADILSTAGSNLQVKELRISGNKLTDKVIADLLCRASASLSSFELLSFSFIQSSSGTVDIIPLLSSFHCLKSLYVSESPLGVSGIQSLYRHVHSLILRGWACPTLSLMMLTSMEHC